MDESAVEIKKLKADVKDHVVLCVFADETSPLLGLHNFLLPLRSKYMPKDKLKPVVIVQQQTIHRERVATDSQDSRCLHCHWISTPLAES